MGWVNKVYVFDFKFVLQIAYASTSMQSHLSLTQSTISCSKEDSLLLKWLYVENDLSPVILKPDMVLVLCFHLALYTSANYLMLFMSGD